MAERQHLFAHVELRHSNFGHLYTALQQIAFVELPKFANAIKPMVQRTLHDVVHSGMNARAVIMTADDDVANLKYPQREIDDGHTVKVGF